MSEDKKMFTEKQTEIMSQALFDLLFNVGNHLNAHMTDEYINEAVGKYMVTVEDSVKTSIAFDNVRKADENN